MSQAVRLCIQDSI